MSKPYSKFRAHRAQDARERSSATREVAPEARGRRVLTRLLDLIGAMRAQGQEPTVVHLSAADELALFATVETTFGSHAASQARRGSEAWRTFLRDWFRQRVSLELVLDADETRVT